LSLVACTSEQEKREAEDRLRKSLVANYVTYATGGAALLPRVECSDQIDFDKGDRFACTVTALDRTSVVVKAMQTNDRGGGRVLTKLLDTLKVQGQLYVRMVNLAKDNDSVSLAVVEFVDCPDLVVVNEGARFTCRGAYNFSTQDLKAMRQNFKLIGTFTGDRDKFTYTMRLSEPCRPANCQDQ